MKRDQGGTLDKGKQELKSRGEKQKQYMGQSLTEKKITKQDLR